MELGQKFNFDLAPLFVPDKRVTLVKIFRLISDYS